MLRKEEAADLECHQHEVNLFIDFALRSLFSPVEAVVCSTSPSTRGQKGVFIFQQLTK